MTILSLDATVAITRALGHPARLRTLNMLRSGELCMCQITEVLGLAQSTVSAHIRELKRAGLVDERKSGRWVFVTVAEAAEVRPWVDAALATLAGDAQIADDAEMVEEIRRLPVEVVCRLGLAAAKTQAAGAATDAVEPSADLGRRC